jgi:hypothetical protein
MIAIIGVVILGTVIGIIVYFAFCIILGIIAGLAESGYYYY